MLAHVHLLVAAAVTIYGLYQAMQEHKLSGTVSLKTGGIAIGCLVMARIS